MKKIFVGAVETLVALLFCYAVTLSAENLPAAKDVPGSVSKTSISDAHSRALQSSYKDVIIANDAVQSAQRALQDVVNAYNAEAVLIIKEEQLPEGTGLQVDLSSKRVNVVPPQASPKTEAKK